MEGDCDGTAADMILDGLVDQETGEALDLPGEDDDFDEDDEDFEDEDEDDFDKMEPKSKTDWRIGLRHVRWDRDDIEAAKAEGKKAEPIGTIMSSDVASIGPIGIDHNHWTGWTLTVTPEQAQWIVEACRDHEFVKPWPEARECSG